MRQRIARVRIYREALRPDSVSKVRDANGEPLPVYHGTSAEFDTFSLWKIGTNTGRADFGYGFYFSSIKNGMLDSGADWYGEKIGAYFLHIKNPFVAPNDEKELARALLSLDVNMSTKTGKKISERLEEGLSILMRDIDAGYITVLLQSKGYDGGHL